MAQNVPVFLLRVSLGWLFFYAGITKILNPAWTAEGYLKGAKTFTDFYQWLASPSILPIINFLNEWGLTLLGLSLIVGLFVRLSSLLGIVLMLLYYFPILPTLLPSSSGGWPRSFLVDDHIIYALALLYLKIKGAGRIWGLDGRFLKSSSILG